MVVGRGGGLWLPGCRAPSPKTENKKGDLVDTVISNVLCELPFSINQPLKLVDGSYIGILKNKMKTFEVLYELKKTTKIRPCGLS